MSKTRDVINTVEETIIAVLLAGMALVTFSQVVARYAFNSGAVWALELTTLLFAWLVLFGMSYGIKVGLHLGVDFFVNMLGPKVVRAAALFAVACGVAYASILFVGSWVYLTKLYKIGITTEDLHLPRWLAYSILPIGLALLGIRCVEAGIQIWRGERASISASHEAEDLVREAQGAGGMPHPEKRA
jgi:C4-dicarboxylate transporter DctQ subunit